MDGEREGFLLLLLFFRWLFLCIVGQPKAQSEREREREKKKEDLISPFSFFFAFMGKRMEERRGGREGAIGKRRRRGK